MTKDFEKWNALERKIESEHAAPMFREREIWWCSIGMNVGFEQDGKGEQFARPVIIFRKFNNEVFGRFRSLRKLKPANIICR